MSENENIEVESGALEEGASPELPESTPSKELDSPESKPAKEAKEPEVPFHEHPRFKELVEQKNQERSRAEQLEQQYRAMEQRLTQLMEANKPKAPTHPMIEKLKGIDPEFADYIQELQSKTSKLDQFERWQAQQEQEKIISRAVNHVNTLHEKNKIAPEDREIYNQILDSSYMRGDIKSMQDLDAVYAKVHETFTKRAEAIKRAERASYLGDKKTDAKTPTSPSKGKAPTNSKTPEWPKDPQEARQELIRRVLTQSKAENTL